MLIAFTETQGRVQTWDPSFIKGGGHIHHIKCFAVLEVSGNETAAAVLLMLFDMLHMQL